MEQQPNAQEAPGVQSLQRIQDVASSSCVAPGEPGVVLRALIDALPDYIFVKDRQARFITVNRSLLTALGVDAPDEVIGKTDHDYHRPEMARAFALDDENVMSRGEPLISHGEQHEDVAGKRRWLSTTKVPLKDAAGKVIGLIGISRDISDVKEIEMERDAVLRDLARSNQDLEQFAYVVSHDLKAPLRAITNLSTWIEEDLTDCLTEDSKQYMRLLRQRVARLDLLISDILKYSRAGCADAQAVVVDSGALVRGVVGMLHVPAGCVVTIMPNMPTIETHKTALEQVFANLIGNAVKHHHDRSHAEIDVAATDAGAFVEFSVRDNGPGIDVAFHRRIFEVFRTLQSGDQAESSGIGLSIVKRLVERWGGEVRLESQAEAGAKFSFTWPKRLRDNQRESRRNAPEADAVQSGLGEGLGTTGSASDALQSKPRQPHS